MFSENTKIFAGYALICLLWGSTWLAIRVGLDSLTPILAAGIRFSLASVLFYTLMKYKKIRVQRDPLSIKLYLIMGIFSFVIPFGLVYWAEQFIATGLTSVLFAIFPFIVIMFSRILIPNETIGPFKIIGSVIAFIGIYFIFSDDLSMDVSTDIWGMAAVLVSATMQGVVAVIIKKHGRELNPLTMNLFPVLIAGIIMIPLGILTEDMSRVVIDYRAIFSVSYLALFGTVLTFTTYYWLMKRMNLVILSLNSLITPIIAVLLGWFILNESLSMHDLLGTLMVLIGLVLANIAGIIKYYRIKTV